VMRSIRLLPLCVCLLLLGSGRAARGDELPPAAKETLDAYESEVAEIQKKAEDETKKAAEKVVVQLKLLQDKFCKDAKLDEAVAIRDQIRQFQGGAPNPHAADLPAAARETLEAYEKELAEVQKRAAARVKKAGDKTAKQLKLLQDKFCKEAK